MTDTGIERNDLEQAFAQPNEIAEAVTRLVVTEGLVGSGRAARVGSFSLGPRVGDRRRVEIEWTDPRVYTTSSRRCGDSSATGSVAKVLNRRRVYEPR